MRASSPPLVDIILLNWNGYRDTLACLKSLWTLNYPRFEVIVVDNASTDGSEEILRASCPPEVIIVQSGANLGFAGGNNRGIKVAMEHGADYIWLLNNDTLVEPDTLTSLVVRAEAEPTLGLIGSRILFAEPPHHIWFAGGVLSPENGLATHQPYDVPDAPEYQQLHATEFLTGCSILARRQTVEQIGGLPEMYFLYYEDVDWTFLARRHGWGVFYEPRSVVYHKVSASVGSSSSKQLYYATRARLIFVKRHMRQTYGGAIRYTLSSQIALNLLRNHPRVALSHLCGLCAGIAYRVSRN